MGCPPSVTTRSTQPNLKNHCEKSPLQSPTTPTNIIHTCHVGIHVDFSSIDYVISCSPKLPSCKLKDGAHESLNQ